MRKLGRELRVHSLQGFVSSLLFNPDSDKSLSALAWMGLASSRSTHESDQQKRAAESRSQKYDGAGGGFPEVPSKSLIVGMYDNIGMRLQPGREPQCGRCVGLHSRRRGRVFERSLCTGGRFVY